VFTHEHGWEVRLVYLPQLKPEQTQVCATEEEVFDCGDKWKAAMIEKGWT
jgi:hypothetical protein